MVVMNGSHHKMLEMRRNKTGTVACPLQLNWSAGNTKYNFFRGKILSNKVTELSANMRTYIKSF